jgi:hypothetical protein
LSTKEGKGKGKGSGRTCQSAGYGVAGEDVELLGYIMSESIGYALEMVIKGLTEVCGCVDKENE